MLSLGAFKNLLQTEMAVNGAVEMSYPESAMFYVGIVFSLAVVLYAIPRAMLFGGLLTTWLGGEVANHLIQGDAATLTIVPIVFGMLVWVSIVLKNENVGRLLLGKKNVWSKFVQIIPKKQSPHDGA
jgi:hypothetical protein